MYRQLVPDRPQDQAGLVHPDPSVELARVAAKKLLCRAALGEDPPTAADLAAFERAYPGAGRQACGPRGALSPDHRPGARRRPARADRGARRRWPTFAGSATRTKVVPGAVDVGSLQWSVDLVPVTSGTRTFGMGRMGRSPFPMQPDPRRPEARLPSDRPG